MNNIALLCNSLKDWFGNPLAIVSIALVTVGLAIILLAKDITRFVRKSKEVKHSDRLFAFLALLGLVMLLVGLLLVIVAVVSE